MESLDQILDQMLADIDNIPGEAWEYKLTPDKWSKKEILGHLVDSARNNLQRFTEVTYFDQPYQVINYSQDESVMANQYQNAPLTTIKEMWVSLNRHIAYLMRHESAENLAKTVVLPDGTETDLRWLMEDYITHLIHHKDQILA